VSTHDHAPRNHHAGKLVITNKRETMGGFNYTSGTVNTISYPPGAGRGFQQTYGYFEARILPSPGQHNMGMYGLCTDKPMPLYHPPCHRPYHPPCHRPYHRTTRRATDTVPSQYHSQSNMAMYAFTVLGSFGV